MKRVIRAAIDEDEELEIFYDILYYGVNNVIAEGIYDTFGKFDGDSEVIFENYDPKKKMKNNLVDEVDNIIDDWAHETTRRVISYLNIDNKSYTNAEDIPDQILNYKGLMHKVDMWVNQQFDNAISAADELYNYSPYRDVLEADLYNYALHKLGHTSAQQQIEEEQIREDKANDLINDWVITTADNVQRYLEDNRINYSSLDNVPVSYIPVDTLLQNISVLYK